jgi:apolipoprotein N-acyltransferase
MSKASALVLCALSSVLYFLTFLNFDLYPLIWFSLVPVLCAIRGATTGKALMIGTVFGLFTNAGGYYWIVHLLQEFGGANLFVALLGYVLLCTYQGFLLAIVIALVRLADRSLRIAPVWSLAVVFPALELVYPLVFPSYISNSQLQFSAITQVVEITGIVGLTALIGLVNGALYEVVDSRLAHRKIQPLRVGAPAALFALCVAYGLIRLPQIDAATAAAPKVTVGLIQTNIGAADKAADPDTFIERHHQMSQALVAAHPEVDLVVWPESAYNSPLHRSQQDVSAQITRGVDRPVLFGAITFGRSSDGNREIYNSLLLTSAKGAITDVYDKIELLVFGETYPLSETFPFLSKVFGSSWFTRGQSLQALQFGDHKLLPTICYEDINAPLVRRLWRDGGVADALVNVTNDSWYGDTHQPMQHLALASFRSIETRRALIRSTNTGISALVDPAGRIAQRTGQWTQETLVGAVPLIKDGTSTIYMRIGNVFGWLCVIMTVVGVWMCRQTSIKGNGVTTKRVTNGNPPRTKNA